MLTSYKIVKNGKVEQDERTYITYQDLSLQLQETFRKFIQKRQVPFRIVGVPPCLADGTAMGINVPPILFS